MYIIYKHANFFPNFLLPNDDDLAESDRKTKKELGIV